MQAYPVCDTSSSTNSHAALWLGCTSTVAATTRLVSRNTATSGSSSVSAPIVAVELFTPKITADPRCPAGQLRGREPGHPRLRTRAPSCLRHDARSFLRGSSASSRTRRSRCCTSWAMLGGYPTPRLPASVTRVEAGDGDGDGRIARNESPEARNRRPSSRRSTTPHSLREHTRLTWRIA